MNYFCVDASALAKRYVPEVGSDLMDVLFDTIHHNRLIYWEVELAEVMSILVRQRNGGRITQARFDQAFTDFRLEIIESNDLRILHTTLSLILSALPLIPTHSINGNDAIFLQAALEVAAELRANHNELVIVASDTRLIRAAQAEGLLTFNPETETAADLQRLI